MLIIYNDGMNHPYVARSSPNARGFTIVELIVVIVVIGVLTGVVAVGYGAWRSDALKRAMSSDLEQAATKIQSNKNWASVAYADNELTAGGAFVASSDTTVSFFRRSYGYCLLATNTQTSATYTYKSAVRTAVQGTCDPVASTFAGSATTGLVDGQGTAARFTAPMGGAFDSAGFLCIVDTHAVRKISPTGDVTTLAGATTSGYVDATGTAARFSSVRGVAVDDAGDVYVSDAANQRIRKITPAGVVTTFAGSGVVGVADGQGTAAQFSYPEGLAFDTKGNLIVVDSNNSRIRKISPTGQVTTLAGSTAGYANGVGVAAQFNYPRGVVVDKTNNLYITDYTNHRIRKVTPAGVVSTVAGLGTAGAADGAALSAQFSNPYGITIDALGALYIGDYGNHRIRIITPEGTVSTMLGSTAGFADGTGATVRFNAPRAIVMDKSGFLFVLDSVNSRIRKIE